MNSSEASGAALDLSLVKELHDLAEADDARGYLEALDRALYIVQTIENGEPLVSLNKQTLGTRVHIWLVDLGIECDDHERLWLRHSVVEKLRRAANNLPHGFTLLIRDAFRSEHMVWRLYDLYLQRLRHRQPHFSEHECDVRVRYNLAMPDDPVPPGHMTGGAVDVNLGDENGERVHLEVPESEMDRSLQAPTFCRLLPAEIIERRTVLYKVMAEQGFHNYSREYWHYSYGDAYWAVRRQDKIAIYGIPEL